MTELNVDELTDQLAGAWWRWDQSPGDPVLARRCVEAESAFEAVGVARLDLVAAITENRRGDPDVAGVPGGHRQKVFDAVQSAVNQLVPARLRVVPDSNQPSPEAQRRAS